MRVALASLALVAAAISIATVSVETASAQPGDPTRPYCLRDGIGRRRFVGLFVLLDVAVSCDGERRRRLLQPNPWYTGPVRR